jgi:hypothetical protein
MGGEIADRREVIFNAEAQRNKGRKENSFFWLAEGVLASRRIQSVNDALDAVFHEPFAKIDDETQLKSR